MVYGGDAVFNLFICVLSDADDMKLFTYSNFKIDMMLPNIEKSIKSDEVEYQKINLAQVNYICLLNIRWGFINSIKSM